MIIGFLAALLLGLSGVPEPDSTRRGDFAEAKVLDDCAAKKFRTVNLLPHRHRRIRYSAGMSGQTTENLISYPVDRLLLKRG